MKTIVGIVNTAPKTIFDKNPLIEMAEQYQRENNKVLFISTQKEEMTEDIKQIIVDETLSLEEVLEKEIANQEIVGNYEAVLIDLCSEDEDFTERASEIITYLKNNGIGISMSLLGKHRYYNAKDGDNPDLFKLFGVLIFNPPYKMEYPY